MVHVLLNLIVLSVFELLSSPARILGLLGPRFRLNANRG